MIVFTIPPELNSVTHIIRNVLETNICIWAHNYDVPYTLAIEYDKMIIKFPDASSDTLFLLSWDSKNNEWMEPKHEP